MSGDAIHSAEQRCLRLVTLAENQAKEQRKVLQAEIRRLEEEITLKEEEACKGTKEGSRALTAFMNQLKEAVAVFETKHLDFRRSVQEVAQRRAEQESLAISHMKDAVSQFYSDLRQDRKRKFLKTMADASIASSAISVLEEDDLPFSMQAVSQYLLGSVFVLEQQGVTLLMKCKDFLEESEKQRKLVLLDPERAIFKTQIRQLAPPFISGGWGDGEPKGSPEGSPGRSSPTRQMEIVTPQGLSVILSQRIYDDRETRHRVVTDMIKNSTSTSNENLKRVIRNAANLFDDLVSAICGVPLREHWSDVVSGNRQQSFVEPLPDTTPVHGASTQRGSSSPTPEGGNSKWRRVKGNLGLLQSSTNLLGKQSIANIAAAAINQERRVVEASTAAIRQRLNAARDFVYVINQLDERLIAHVLEQHVEDYSSLNGEYSAKMEQLVRKCISEREIQVFQTSTVFTLDSLKSELDHRETITKVLNEREKHAKDKYVDELKHLEDMVAELQAGLVVLRRENAELKNVVTLREKEVETLRSLAKERAFVSEEYVLQKELRVVQYEVNDRSFGDCWQESLLKMRERILSEVQNDNLRFIARVNNLLKRAVNNDEQMEHLYDARLRSALKEMEDDNQRREEAQVARHVLQLEQLNDTWKNRLEDEREIHEKEKEELRRIYQTDYDTKVEELNRFFDEKYRYLQRSREDTERYFEVKLKEMRQQLRDKDNELEACVAKRFSEMNQHFEHLSDELRNRYAEREKALDREKLVVQANFETKVNDKVTQIRTELDGLGQRLQDTVILFVSQQRSAFEEYREKEMHNFAQFTQISDKITSRKHAEGRRDQLRLHDLAISELKDVHRTEFQLFKQQVEDVAKLQSENLQHRLNEVKLNAEEVLRVTQELRIEQDEQFWNQCHTELVAANRLLIEEKARLETLLQARYSSLIDRCDRYLKNDIAAARESFEVEQRQRYAYLHQYCEHYHIIQLHLEQQMWEEEAERQCIQKEALSEAFTLRVMMAEEKRNVEFCEMLDDNPFAPIGVIKLDELRMIREDYENRLLDKQRFIANLTKDSIATMEGYLRQQHNQHLATVESFDRRLNEIVTTLQEKFRAYYNARSFFVEQEISRIASYAESVVSNSLKVDKSRTGQSTDQQNSADGGAHWSEEVRVMEYFVSMKKILTQAMHEFEDKLEIRFHDMERQKHTVFHKMHLEYLEASATLMKQLENLKVSNDFAEISLQQAKTKLALQSSEHNKAKILCDDLVGLLEANTGSRLHSQSQAAGMTSSLGNPNANVPVPLRTLSDMASLRERIYSEEYTAYAKGALFLNVAD